MKRLSTKVTLPTSVPPRFSLECKKLQFYLYDDSALVITPFFRVTFNPKDVRELLAMLDDLAS